MARRMGLWMVVCLLTLGLALASGAVSSMPVKGGISGTTERLQGDAEVIRSTAGLMATHEAAAVRGLSIALQNHAERTALTIAALEGLDLATATEEEVQAYAVALTELNLALKGAISICTVTGSVETTQALWVSRTALTTYAVRVSASEPRLNSALQQAALAYPGEGELWGQVD